MDKYKVIFLGTPKIAAGILATLTTMESVEVIGVICQPDKLVGRKQEVVFSPVKQFCLDHNLVCYQPKKISEIYDELAKLEIDFLISCAYGQFIPTKILNLAKIEPLNIHGSLLPKYRGGAPIQYAIMNGDQETGVSLMRMVKQMDAGAVFSTRSLEISPTETSGTLFDKLEQLGSKLIKEDLVAVANKTLLGVEQDESLVTFSYNISSDQEKINWNKTNQEIDQLVRALSPTPISYTLLNNERYKIGAVQICADYIGQEPIIPGKILDFDSEGILVQTADGIIKILKIQLPGKPMTAASNYFTSKGTKNLKIGAVFDF